MPIEQRDELNKKYAGLRERLSGLLVADYYLRLVAMVAHVRGGQDTEQLLPLFESENTDIQRMALLAVGPASETAVPAITKVLYGDNEKMQQEAIAALQRIGQPGASAVAKAMLDHPNAEIRQAAAERILSVESAAPNLIEALLNSEEEEVRIAAAHSLSYAFFKPGQYADSTTATRSFEPTPLEQRAISALVETLASGNTELQIASARGLRSLVLGPHRSLTPLVPKLIDRLRESDGEVKSNLASVLGAIGADAVPAIPSLLKGLESIASPSATSTSISNSFDPRESLIRAIGGIGVRTVEVETTLLAILQDAEQARSHTAVIETLGQLRVESAVPALVQFFSQAQVEYGGWGTAAETLLKIDPAGVDALTSLLADGSQPPALRQRACQVLASSHSMDERIVQALKAAATDPDAIIRLNAAHGLADRRIAGEIAIPVFVQWFPYLNRSSGGLRKLLDSMHSYPEPAAAALEGLLKQVSDVEALNQVIATLSELQKSDPRLSGTTTYLTNFIREDAERLVDGIETLGELGIVSDQSAAIAIKGLSHRNSEVRQRAALALRNLRLADPQVAIAALLELLNREAKALPAPAPTDDKEFATGMMLESRTLDAVLETLASYGPDARSAIPALVELLAHAWPFVRASAATTLGGIGLDTEEVRSKLAQLLDDPDRRVYEAATQALLNNGADPESLGPKFAENTILEYLNSDLQPFFWTLSRELSPRYLNANVGSAAEKGAGDALPQLPWPPPRYTHRATFGRDIPRNVLGDDDSTLGEIYDKLYRALVSVDESFESGLFGVGHDGFALLAKLERIDEQGAPLPGDNRWVYGELPPLSFKDYIGRLFFEKPGYFRVLAFVVTPKNLVGYSDTRLPHTSEGGSELPDHIAKLKFKDRNCYVLVYSFQRKRGGKFTLYDKLGPQTHLIKSGILASFGSL
ncbi:MAG: HEAT repeat domain-containing protein [Planctomycetota bacterium]|nr:HEAT repeat domain-containing protein [Planctomycetota bacterium]